MKYLYEMNTELNMTYLDKLTFMNHVKNFAKENLGLASDNTPYIFICMCIQSRNIYSRI